MFLARKQRMRNLDPLMGRINVVAAQDARHVVARVIHDVIINSNLDFV
jgi:hypothetical protein